MPCLRIGIGRLCLKSQKRAQLQPDNTHHKTLPRPPVQFRPSIHHLSLLELLLSRQVIVEFLVWVKLFAQVCW